LPWPKSAARPAKPSAKLALAPADAKTAALKAAAAAIRSRADEILAANADDLAEAKAGRSDRCLA